MSTLLKKLRAVDMVHITAFESYDDDYLRRIQTVISLPQIKFVEGKICTNKEWYKKSNLEFDFKNFQSELWKESYDRENDSVKLSFYVVDNQILADLKYQEFYPGSIGFCISEPRTYSRWEVKLKGFSAKMLNPFAEIIEARFKREVEYLFEKEEEARIQQRMKEIEMELFSNESNIIR